MIMLHRNEYKQREDKQTEWSLLPTMFKQDGVTDRSENTKSL